jgi:hypothetical protein
MCLTYMSRSEIIFNNLQKNTYCQPLHPPYLQNVQSMTLFTISKCVLLKGVRIRVTYNIVSPKTAMLKRLYLVVEDRFGTVWRTIAITIVEECTGWWDQGTVYMFTVMPSIGDSHYGPVVTSRCNNLSSMVHAFLRTLNLILSAHTKNNGITWRMVKTFQQQVSWWSAVLTHQDPTASKVVPQLFVGIGGAKSSNCYTAQFYDLEQHLK